MRTGIPIVGLEEREEWPDGRVTWVSTTKVPLRSRDKRMIGIFGLSRDITERKLADQRAQEQAGSSRSSPPSSSSSRSRTSSPTSTTAAASTCSAATP